jgi:small redox-active disulfide protein 2
METAMQVLVLGTGCAKCTKLHDNAAKAIAELGIDAELAKVSDIQQIMAHGVMMTPALVVDGEVKVVGKVPSAEEIKGWLG